MSIKNERIAYFTDKILKENLQRGLLPDSREFIWQLNQALKNVDGDRKSFRFRPYQNTEQLASAKLNRDNQAIYDDLFILYKNIAIIHQLLNQQYTYFTVERDKLEKHINVLENRLRQLARNAQRGGIFGYSYDTFDTTEQVDMQATNQVFVDTDNNAVHLVEEKNTSTRLFPASTVRFNFEPKGADKKEETIGGSLATILNEEADYTWQKQISLKENLSVTGELIVGFENAQALNHIQLSVFTVKEMQLRIRYTPDGSNWYALPYHAESFGIEKQVTLDFPTLQTKGLRFVFEKNEYDDNLPEPDGYNYQYLFGLDHLAFYQKSYPTQGTFVSQPLVIQNQPENYTIDTVQLYTDDWQPTGTQIRYFVALDADEPTWQPLAPMNQKHPTDPQQVNFNRLRRGHLDTLFFPDEFSIRQSEAEDLLKNGIPLYRLSSRQQDEQRFELPKRQILEGSTRLYVGKNSWEVTSFPSAKQDTPEPAEFQAVTPGLETTYLPVQPVRSGAVFQNETATQQRTYRLRLGLYSQNEKTVTASPVSTDPLSIYLNGERLFAGRPEGGQDLHYVLRPGWNELVVFVRGLNATTVNGMSLALGFDATQVATHLYSSAKPLTEVSVFDLQYNTKIHDHSVFAKRETEAGIEILTNFGEPGLAFDLTYDYADNLEDKALLFKAEFERQNGANVPSPILRHYRLDYS